MPLNRLATDAGIYKPEELQLLGRVFDHLQETASTTEKSEQLASRLLANCMAGIRGEDELIALSRLPLRR